MRCIRSLAALALIGIAVTSACSSPPVADGGDADAAADVPTQCTDQAIHSLNPEPVYIVVGQTQRVQLRLLRDRTVEGTYEASSEMPGIVTTESASGRARFAIVPFRSTGEFVLRGVAPGRTRVRAEQVAPTPHASCRTTSMTVDVIVLDPAVPACATTTAPVNGMLAPGVTIAGMAGTPLAAARIDVPAMATNISPMPVTIRCAADQIPMGYRAVGPAITFGPGRHRFPREVSVQIPINPGLVSSYHELSTEIAYTAPGWSSPRVVAMTDTRFSHDGSALMFRAFRLGTYQAVVRDGLGTRRVRRRYVYRALLGASMGGMGSSMIGARHPELFDFIMPIGGPADWGFYADMAYRWLLGGFCTEAQRATLGAACDRATNQRTPDPTEPFMPDQNFEFFYYPTGTMGQGTTADRAMYGSIFFDLSSMFGNPFNYPDPANGRLPMGVPASELMRPTAERCSRPVVIGGVAGRPRYYDDEYNPTGEYPVITFCDGTNTRANVGEWDGGIGNFPYDALLAVDRNRNGRRDAGEPVIRNMTEPFDDVGVDGLPNERETGFDAVNNPDPAGDDYDRQYNPGGTEGNFLRDEGEPYRDLGLDGVRCPAGEMCPYDFGEGNGRFDVAPGYARFREYNSREIFARMPQAEIHRLNMWADGGYRDFFNFGTSAHHWAGAISQRGEDLHIYGGFSSMMAGHGRNNQACTSDAQCGSFGDGTPRTDWFCDRGTCRPDDAAFVTTDVDYEHMPAHNLLRYGHEDITMSQYLLGDGGHVGTGPQITNRTFVALWFVHARWPNLDRQIATFSSMPDNAGRCARGYFCTFDFTATTTGRTGPVSIYLPPGYHRPENQERRYPVVYFMHGYGMDPSDLVASGILVGNYMSSGQVAEWQRPGKFIMVFPDGRCRAGDGCRRGTFYVDSPVSGNARMESYFLDLFQFVENTYRTRRAEEVEITE